MKYIVRYAVRNLWRVWGRTVALFGVLLLLVTIASTGFYTLLAIRQEKGRIQEETPIAISVYPRISEEKTYSPGSYEYPRFTLEDVYKALSSPYVKAVGAHIPAFGGFTTVGGIFRADKLPDIEDYNEVDTSSFVLPHDLFGPELPVIASSAPHLYPAFRNNTFTLKEGREPVSFPTQLSLPNEILLPASAAEYYGLSVGDSVYVVHLSNSSMYIMNYTLCGTYETEHPATPYAFISLGQHFRLNLTIPNAREMYLYKTFESLEIEPYDSGEAAAVIRDAAETWLNLGVYEASANDGMYKQIVARLDEGYLLIAVFTYALLGFGFALFLLLVLHFISGRSREVGILRALGNPPSHILAIMAIELTVIVAFALLAGFAAARGLTTVIIQYISAQIKPEEVGLADLIVHSVNYVPPANIRFTLSVPGTWIPFLYITAGAAAAILLALFLWWRRIMRLEPMEILSEGEHQT